MMAAADRDELRALPGNDRCIDCPRRNPEWASVSLGVFVCLECSGQHRGLGTHISFVRSVRMDSWSDAQLAKMRASGGNDACRDFLRAKGGIDPLGTSIRDKYDSPAGELWRSVLTARVEGKEEPTELPEDPNVVSEEDDSDYYDSDDEDDDASDDEDQRRRRGRRRNNPNTGANVGGAVKIMEGFGSSPHPSTLSPKKRRGRRILGAAAAGIGAIAGLAINRRRRQKRKSKNEMVSVSLSTRL